MQVYMYTGGVLDAHDNVTFEANTAGDDGGAVRLPFKRKSHLLAVVSCGRLCKDWFDSLRELTELCRKG